MLIRVVEVDPNHASLPWETKWHGPDLGLIAAWVRGRELARENEELAQAARQGELVTLPWKGGVGRPTTSKKSKARFGPLRYLAMWQGLRGDVLEIDTTAEVTLTCSRTHTEVTFTPDVGKYVQISDEG